MRVSSILVILVPSAVVVRRIMLVVQQATNCDPKDNSQLIRHFNKLYPQKIECFTFLPFLFDKRLQSD